MRGARQDVPSGTLSGPRLEVRFHDARGFFHLAATNGKRRVAPEDLQDQAS
jgi:hypothetical protein